MNDQLLQTSRKPRVSAAACVLAACVLAAAVLAGCVPVQAIRTQLPPPVGTPAAAHAILPPPKFSDVCDTGRAVANEPLNIIEDYGDYLIGYAEFDDQGWAYSGETQLHAIQDRLHADLTNPEYAGADFLVIVFVHGWHHNAHDNDCNVQEMRQMIKMTSNQFKQAFAAKELARPRRVIGIYAGWRGESVDAWGLRYTTVLDRRNAAEKVAKGSIRQLLANLQVQETSARQTSGRIAANDPVDWADRMYTTVVGHSFGGLIVYNGLSQDLIDGLTTACTTVSALAADPTRRPWPDEVLLINPAFEASRFETLNRLGLRSGDCQGLARLPLVTVITADNDEWTGPVFTAARRLLTLFEPYDSSSREVHDQEKDANIHAIGFVERYKTHRLCLQTYQGKPRAIVYPLTTPAPAPAAAAPPHAAAAAAADTATGTAVRQVWVVDAPKTIIDGHDGFLFVKTADDGYQPFLLQWLISMHMPGNSVQGTQADCADRTEP
jgi:opacity protein-like surface antigen